MILKNKVNWICLTLLLMMKPCLALPSDREQPLQLRADQADLNQDTRRGIYRNHVVVDQGSTHLRATYAVTEVNQENKLIKAVAKGSPQEQTHFWTTTDSNKPPLHAYADILRYFPEKHLIQLIGHARVEQGTDTFSAPVIHFDTLHHHVMSKSNGQDQTVIIIHPEKKS